MHREPLVRVYRDGGAPMAGPAAAACIPMRGTRRAVDRSDDGGGRKSRLLAVTLRVIPLLPRRETLLPLGRRHPGLLRLIIKHDPATTRIGEGSEARPLLRRHGQSPVFPALAKHDFPESVLELLHPACEVGVLRESGHVLRK